MTETSNDIVIDEVIVSGFHLQIKQDSGQWVVIHPHPLQPHHKTTNGILYQGKHYPGDMLFTRTLSNGDMLRIGNEHGTLVTLTYYDGSGITRLPVPDIAPIPLGAPLITLGLDTGNTIVLNHPQVSNYHARYECNGQTYSRKIKVDQDHYETWDKGASVSVCYLPDEPQVSRLTPLESNVGVNVGCAILCFLITLFIVLEIIFGFITAG
ncbi:FHA domain-containing protein [Reticulibacter mediterranei]|nr:FHA domain-containing protein [Reticulibacter mediterranei]